MLCNATLCMRTADPKVWHSWEMPTISRFPNKSVKHLSQPVQYAIGIGMVQDITTIRTQPLDANKDAMRFWPCCWPLKFKLKFIMPGRYLMSIALACTASKDLGLAETHANSSNGMSLG